MSTKRLDQVVKRTYGTHNPRTDPSTFYAFEEILREAKDRGHDFEVARGVYSRRFGVACPFFEIRPTTDGAPTASVVTMAATGLLRIDFETRSRCDIRTCGAAVYARHPSTEVLCMGWRLGDEETKIWTPDDDGLPNEIAAYIVAGGLISAFNVEFEQEIWEHVCVPKYGWQPVPISQWRDAMAQCHAFAIPANLEDAAAAMGTPVQKDMAGHAVMMKLSRPRKPTKHDTREWHDDQAMFAKLYAYCRTDVDAEHAVSEAVPELSAAEQEVWKVSNIVNRRGIYCDAEGCQGALRMMQMAIADYHKQVAEATGGVVTGENLGSWQAILPWCTGRGVVLPNYQKGTLQEALKLDLPADVRVVLTARLATGRTSTAKFQSILDRRCSDGRLRGQLVYHGANTGRWAAKGVQLQNLPQGEHSPANIEQIIADMKVMDLEDFRYWWGDPMAAASSCIRAMLAAAPGKILISADYSSIEARVVNWLAGQQDMVDRFARGEDLYKHMAAMSYHCTAAEVTKKQRNLGKAQVLGCGFGCGAEKFHGLATKPPYNCVLTEEEAKAAVDLYRETHPKVVGLWKDLEAQALACVRSGTPTRAASGRITFRMFGPHLQARLPSGRIITYPFAQVQQRKTPWGQMKDCITFMGEDAETHQWTRLHTYGGSLTENMVQAIARDLMALAMVRAEGRGFPVVLTVHDELIAEIDDTPISATPEEFCALICESPAWAAGIPVASEGWKSYRYRK